MSSTTSFVMVGGFLGAGKTTMLARLAEHYATEGKRVGLVTNDQAAHLVDTSRLRGRGFAVQEVAGACFCCKFDDLVARVERLIELESPDVILAEPVGSCTDLVATVIRPLKAIYPGRFVVAPYAVLYKPSFGAEVLDERVSPSSAGSSYIFQKQLEEADAIAVNRIDEMTGAEREALCARLETRYPGVPVLLTSAKTGDGVDRLIAFLDQTGTFGRRRLDVDYDRYADGEAELAWLNGTVSVRGARFDVDDLLVDILTRLQRTLDSEGADIAHLKLVGDAEGRQGVASLSSRRGSPELAERSGVQTEQVAVIVNARVAGEPAVLEDHVRKAVAASCAGRNVSCDFHELERFRPGRPVPTHRYVEPEPLTQAGS